MTLAVAFQSVCWALAGYFLVIAHIQSGFPPKDWTGSSGASLALSVFFFLLPFAKSLSLGSLFKFEAKIDQIKHEIDAFKEETRNIANLQASMITRVTSSVAQNTTFNIPSLSDAYSAERRIAEHAPATIAPESQDRISQYIANSISEPNVALARLRMELEAEFRRILGKRTDLGGKVDAKFLSLRSLWQEFFTRFPDKRFLLAGITYVNDVCNAAIHGQIVPADHTVEALTIGLRILDVLRGIPDIQHRAA